MIAAVIMFLFLKHLVKGESLLNSIAALTTDISPRLAAQ